MPKIVDVENLKKRLREDEEISWVMYDRIKLHINAVAVEEKHGQWLPQIVLGQRVWDCSECKTIGRPWWKRCPVCEAKMDGGKKDGN